MSVCLMEAYVRVTIAVLDIDNHITNDICSRPVAGKLLVGRLCIILLCLKKLVVEINIIGFHLIQFTGRNQGFYNKALSLSAVLKS